MEEKNTNNNPLPQTFLEEKPSAWRSFLSAIFGKQRWAIYSLLLIVVVLLGVIWASLERASNSAQPEASIWFDIGGESVRAGRETYFEIVMENHDVEDFKNVGLEVVYPEGFRFLRSSPASSDDLGRSFSLPDLVQDGSQKVGVWGIFSGSPEEVKTVRARLFFQLKNSNTTYSTVQSGQVVLEPPDFNLRVTAPTEHINGQIIDYHVSFENISDQPLSRVEVRAEFPQGFEFSDSSVAPASPGVWRIGSLDVAEAVDDLRISGTLTGQVGDDKVVIFDLGYLDNDGKFVLQSRTSFSCRIKDAPLEITQFLDVAKDFLVEGERATYTIKYKNVGYQGIHNIRLYFKLESTAVDITDAQLKGGALVNKEFIWTAAGVPDLALMQPQDESSISIQFRVLNDLIRQGYKSPVVKTSIFFTSDELPLRVPGPELVIPVQTRLYNSVSATHVSGPEPPEPGQTSVYKITVQIANSVNSVSDAIWFGNANTPLVNMIEDSITPKEAVGAITYNASSGRILWRLDKMAAFESRQASFNVAVTPTIASSGSVWTLMTNMNLTGKDEVTEQILNEVAEDIQTERP